MRLQVNGVLIDFKEDLTIGDLLKKRDVMSPKMVSVELNEQMVEQEKYDSVWLKDNDKLKFLFSIKAVRN